MKTTKFVSMNSNDFPELVKIEPEADTYSGVMVCDSDKRALADVYVEYNEGQVVLYVWDENDVLGDPTYRIVLIEDVAAAIEREQRRTNMPNMYVEPDVVFAGHPNIYFCYSSKCSALTLTYSYQVYSKEFASGFMEFDIRDLGDAVGLPDGCHGDIIALAREAAERGGVALDTWIDNAVSVMEGEG